MKKALVVLIVLTVSSMTYAADTTSAFIMPYTQLAPKTGQTAVTLGVKASYALKHNFFVGVTYQRIMNTFMPLTEDDTRKEFTSQWGGIDVDYMILDREVYRFYLSGGFGLGGIDIVVDEPGVIPEENETYQYFHLGANIDIPFSERFFLSMGWNYRFVSEIDYKNVQASDVAGVNAKLGVRYLFFK